MLNNWVVALSQRLPQLGLRPFLLSRVDQTQSEQRASLGELARRGATRQIRPDDADTVHPRTAVDETERGGSGELGPIRGSSQPVEVLAEEPVRGGAAMGKGVGEGDGGVVNGVAVLE
jgi:hypothetical protein